MGYFEKLQNVWTEPRNWFAHVPLCSRWEEKYRAFTKSSLSDVIHCWGQWSPVISGCLIDWFKQRKISWIHFLPQHTTKLGRLGDLRHCESDIFSQTNTRASERQHGIEVQSTVAEFARPDLKCKFCHSSATWVWANYMISQCPQLSQLWNKNSLTLLGFVVSNLNKVCKVLRIVLAHWKYTINGSYYYHHYEKNHIITPSGFYSDRCELFSKVGRRAFFRCLVTIDLGDVQAIWDPKILWEWPLVSLLQGAASVRNCHLGKILDYLSHGWGQHVALDQESRGLLSFSGSHPGRKKEPECLV